MGSMIIVAIIPEEEYDYIRDQIVGGKGDGIILATDFDISLKRISDFIKDQEADDA